jgi:hypothetical protein
VQELRKGIPLEEGTRQAQVPGHSGNNMMASYTTLTEVESQTRAGVMYRIQMNDDNGHLTCSFPSFKFQRLEVDARSCKHTKLIEEMGVETFRKKLKVKQQEKHQQWVTEEDLIVWATV